VSRSSTEVEYKSLTNATVEIIWVQSLMKELNISSPSPARLWCDNIEATYLLANPMFHARKNILKLTFISEERVARKLLDIRFISSKQGSIG
jgi:hypothetical protein